MSNVSINAAQAVPGNSVARRYQQRPGRWMVVFAVLFSLLALLPLGFVVGVAIDTGWQTVKTLVFRPRVGELLINTLLLVMFTLPICALLGVALAWLTERTRLPGRRIWSVLAIAPLAIPAFVQSYAWISLVPGMHGLAAGVFISVVAYFPFIYLPVSAVLRRLDPGLEDVATSLGTKPWVVFFRVILPQLKLAIWGGSLLIALHLLAEYGLYAMIRFDTFTTAIFDQFQSTFNGPAANMLAGVLVLCCLGLLVVESVSRGRARYARVGSGSARSQNPYSLSPLTGMLCQLLPLALTALALGVPFITLTRWLYLGGFAIWDNSDLWPAVRQTLTLAASGALIITLCAIPMAWLSVRYPARLYRVLEGCNYVTSSLPGQVGQPQELYLRPVDEPTATFLGETLVLSANLEQGWADCVLGRIAVDNRLRRGPARIMLRPEQIQLGLSPQPAQRQAVVTHIDFAGFVSTLSLLMADSHETVEIKTVSREGIRVGSNVSLNILGQAHIFAD